MAMQYSYQTSFFLSNEQLKIFSDFVLDGQQWMILFDSHSWDINVLGREITRPSNLTCNFESSQFNWIPGPRNKDFQLFAKRLSEGSKASPFVGNSHFWRADYMVHSRQNWKSTVKSIENYY